ncbi:flagellar hook-associated protein FlgK [Citricoccus sp. GCM10030269]|uniref:flagellar hook-associated protein FlgK n=1 Tax=Citricoccus sp. GCM10030269 TaxID=3273388 RepID=UPI00360F2BB2
MGLSTFSTLNTAARGLEAARAQIAVTAQNTANAGTVGYTRQSAQLQAAPGIQPSGLFPDPTGPGQGVDVVGIGRSSSELLNRQVRTAVGQSGFQQVRAEAYSGVEDLLREPGDSSVSTAVNDFHAAWADVANHPEDTGAASVLLEKAAALASRLRGDVHQLENQYTAQSTELRAEVEQVNALAGQLAGLNDAIRQTTAANGSANELLDVRDQVAEQLTGLTGGQLRLAADGTSDFLVGGNALVSGEDHRTLTAVVGNGPGEPATVSWSHRLGSGIPASAGIDGGSIAGRLSVLSDVGPLATATEAYDALAASIASTTNAVHSTGFTGSGTAGGPFFAYDAGRGASSLAVAVTDPSGVAHGAEGAGALDGTIADQIAQLGPQVTAPWTGFVTTTGGASRSALDGLSLSVGTESAARASQQSLASVDRDEEAVNLVTFQHAYQASARVLTAVDEMLDQLINRTGLVGR